MKIEFEIPDEMYEAIMKIRRKPILGFETDAELFREAFRRAIMFYRGV